MNRPVVDWNSAAKDYGVVRFGGDEDLNVLFYTKSVQDPNASVANGAPTFKNVAYVKIFRAGEMMNIIDRPVEEFDKQRFRDRWLKYLDDKVQIPEGTPIELLFPNNPAIADGLKARGVHTIQQCASLTAHAIEGLGMGGQEYVNRANQYIKSATDGKTVIAMQEDLKKKDQTISLLQKQIDELSATVRGLTAKMSAPVEFTPQGTVNAPFIQGVDPQADRIAANHPTSEILAGKKK